MILSSYQWLVHGMHPAGSLFFLFGVGIEPVFSKVVLEYAVARKQPASVQELLNYFDTDTDLDTDGLSNDSAVDIEDDIVRFS
jgi:hypothetical protein